MFQDKNIRAKWGENKMIDNIVIFDTTLRDGEQCPGASLNTNEKLEVARQLENLNVDVIEAGSYCFTRGF